VDDAEWLRRLHEACRAALERVNNPELDVDHQLKVDLADYCTQLERRLRDAEARVAGRSTDS
jgi:hypothetical protein